MSRGSALALAVITAIGTIAMQAGWLPQVVSAQVSMAATSVSDVFRAYSAQEVLWGPCSYSGAVSAPGADLKCAHVRVPMDWNAPGAHSEVQLSISLSKSQGVSKGLLVANPGGPGGLGLAFTQSLAKRKPQLAHDFDLLGFDPRGFGDSTNVKCLATTEELSKLPFVVDYREINAATLAAKTAEARVIAEACARDEFAPFVNTAQTARDMEFLRQLVGSSKLHYVGYSYGTWLGATYVASFTASAGRVVLDSNLDWTTDLQTAMSQQVASMQRRRDSSFFPWVARHDAEYHLGKTPLMVASQYEAIRASVARNAYEGHVLPGPGELDQEIASYMYRDMAFPKAAQRLLDWKTYGENPAGGLPTPASALAASPELTSEVPTSAADQASVAVRQLQVARHRAGIVAAPPAPQEWVNLGALGIVVQCNDSVWSTDEAKYSGKWAAEARGYPFVGYRSGIGPCAFWPHHKDSRQSLRLPNSVDLVMIHGEADGVTPFAQARWAHLRSLTSSRMVQVDDEGNHMVWGYVAAPCVDKAVDAYLFSHVKPARDVTCGTVPLPGDSRVYEFVGGVVGGRHA